MQLLNFADKIPPRSNVVRTMALVQAKGAYNMRIHGFNSKSANISLTHDSHGPYMLPVYINQNRQPFVRIHSAGEDIDVFLLDAPLLPEMIRMKP
jgi:hypothetical protein